MKPTDDMSGQDLLEGGIAGEITEYDWQQAEKVAVRLLEIAVAKNSASAGVTLLKRLSNDRLKARVLTMMREINKRDEEEIADLNRQLIALQFRTDKPNHRRGV